MANTSGGINKVLAQLASKQGFLRYLSNTSWLLGEQILRLLAGVLVGIWVARYLGPEKFGIYSYALAFIAILTVLAKLGLDNIVVRNLVQNPERQDVYLGTAFWLKFISGIMVIVVAFLMTFGMSEDKQTSLYILVLTSGIVFQCTEVVDFYFRSKVLSRFVSLCKLAQLVISSALKIYFIVAQADLFYFFIVSLIDQFVLALTFFVVYRLQKGVNFYWSFDLSIAKEYLKDGWPLILSSLVVMFHMRIDQIMIKNMLGEKDVGIYSAALRLTEVWYFIPTIIAASLFSAIVNARKTSEELYSVRLQQLFVLMTWLSILIVLPTIGLSHWLIEISYGNAYIDAAPVLAIQIFAVIFVFNVSARSNALLVEGKQKYVMIFAALALASHVSLNFFLLKSLGIVGAAYASIISWFLSACIFPFLFSDTRHLAIGFYKSFYPRKCL